MIRHRYGKSRLLFSEISLIPLPKYLKKGRIAALYNWLILLGEVPLAREENNYTESVIQFESRKKDHIELSLDSRTQATEVKNFARVELVHDALPDLDFSDISLNTNSLGKKDQKAFYVAAMTAGHKEAEGINYRLAEACSQTGWLMMLGSQRRELFDPNEKDAWSDIRKAFPNISLVGNLGLSQISSLDDEQVQAIVDSTGCVALAIHCNVLQEAIQPEGTPHFKNSLARLAELTEKLEVPIVLKETGCGFSGASLSKLKGMSLGAIDVSGMGGTHWGRLEGLRAEDTSFQREAAEVFANWGIDTVDSTLNVSESGLNTEVWGSGGVRNGLDAAKLFALGAKRVGMAKPLLEKAMVSKEAVVDYMNRIEYQCKVALLCTGSKNIESLKGKWIWKKS